MAKGKSAPKAPTIAPDLSGTLVGGKPKPSPTMPHNPVSPGAPADKAKPPAEPAAVIAAPMVDPLVTPPGKPVRPINMTEPSGPLSGPLVASAPGSGLNALRGRG